MKRIQMTHGDTTILVLEQKLAIMLERGWTIDPSGDDEPEITIDEDPTED